MGTDGTTIGGFTVDTALVVRSWDPWMERVTGIRGDSARGRALPDLIPDLEKRGLLPLVHEVIAEGTVRVLAPAFHGYLIACAPRRRSNHFEQMQQRITIGALREQDRIVGAMITVEDVTDRLDRERDIADSGGADAALAEAGPSFLAALHEDDWRARRQAAEQLARGRGRNMIASLLTALKEEHQSFAVVSSALQMLSQIDLDVVDPLIEFLGAPDPDLRIQAALGLGEQRDSRAIPALLAALGDADANVRFHAIEALGKLRATGAIDRLLEIARAHDFFLSFAALDALARIGEPRIASLLVPLLDDAMLRNAVVDALGTLGDEATVAPLVALLDRPDAPLDAIVQALASLYRRAMERYGEGQAISDLTRRGVSARAVDLLAAAAETMTGEALRALAIVLGWLEGEAVERTLARLVGDDLVRREVVEALVRFGPRVTHLLVQQLSSESVEARRAAIVALGRIGDRRATSPLLDLLDRDRDTLVTTAGALARIGDPNAYERLFAYLTDEDAAVRQAVIAALNSIGHPDMGERVRRLLDDQDWRARESAVRIAGYFGYPACIDLVFARCHDENEEVRRAAFEHLPFIEDRRVLATLVAALRSDTPPARAAAARALGRVDDSTAAAALVSALADPDAWVRYFSARALAEHRFAPAVGLLADLVDADPAMQVRLASIEAIGQIGTTEAVAVLARLSEQEGEVGLSALRALGSAAHEDAWPPLKGALQSANPGRQMEALRAITQRGGPGATAQLEWTAAAAADPTIVREAIDALGRLAARRSDDAAAAIQALVALTADPTRRESSVAVLGSLPIGACDQVAAGLADPRNDVRCSIVDALGRMRDERATKWLHRALDDAAPEVRKAAIAALVHLGSRGTEGRLAALVRSDPDASVRIAARAAFDTTRSRTPRAEGRDDG